MIHLTGYSYKPQEIYKMPFVFLPTVGRIIPSDSVESVDTSFNIVTKHGVVFPEKSEDPWLVRTTSTASALINIRFKDKSTAPILFTTVELVLSDKEESYMHSSVIASLDPSIQQKFHERVQKCTNYLKKQENFNIAKERADAEATIDPFKHLEGEEFKPVMARPAFLSTPFTEQEIKNQEIRLKNLASTLDRLLETKTDLDFITAQSEIHDVDALAELTSEMTELCALLNG